MTLSVQAVGGYIMLSSLRTMRSPRVGKLIDIVVSLCRQVYRFCSGLSLVDDSF